MRKCKSQACCWSVKNVSVITMACLSSYSQCILYIIICFGLARAEFANEFANDVIVQCIHKCPFQNRTDGSHYDFGCGSECSIEMCNNGCALWTKALETSCQTVCNVTSEVLSPSELFCVMGCNEALNNYFQRLKDKIGTPPAPALVADSLTSTSLSLEWEGTRHSNLSYLVQWRYEELAGAWQYCRNQTWGHHSVVRVENLQPYTKYRFRVAVLLSARHSDPIVSAPSVVISTLPLGLPTSAPIELRVSALDSHRISLSWEPGPFPNGPILSYVLRISETPDGSPALKDLPASENSLFYMFQSLSPSVKYQVSVAMRNGEGEGPQATMLVTTLALPTAVASQQPVLILGGRHVVLQQAADNMFVEPTVLYKTPHRIQGVGIDITKNLLFVSDASGSVYKTSLSHQFTPVPILTPNPATYNPLDLSVDWLNGHLYILGEVNHNNDHSKWEGSNYIHWQLVRCDFDGKAQTIAFAGFNSKPVHIEVDPYNGYLFWALQGATSGGLYRLDLADISNGVKHEVIPDQIFKDPNLGAFTVDHSNFRILVPQLNKNTVLSVSLDGREVVDFRNNTQRPMFASVKSLSFANGLFYWTNGEEVFIEEYHQGHDIYFHNVYPEIMNNSCNSVLVALRAFQPIPIAVNPPIGLQGVMGARHAKVSWQPPHLLGHQGNGAWQQWHYHLQITNADDNATVHRSDINGTTSYIAKDLKENTVYIIKAAAVTSSGTGPWSSEFTAKTLATPENGVFSSMLWSAHEGLLKSDLTGDNVQTLIHKSHLHNTYITDISWYRDQLYLVTNMSNVMWYNMTSSEQGWLKDMDNVGSLAVDWVGRKLYWSNPKQQLITRGNLRGGNREPVPIVTVGKELKVDSSEGFIYWNTGHAIECARLNGEHKITYYPAQLFRKQVMGLTVDLEGKLLYWIVHGYEGSNLYKAPTADVITPEMEVAGTLVSSLSGAVTMGPLCYFSDRLIWLQDDAHAVISDLSGQNKANLNGIAMAYVNTIAVIDPNLQNMPVVRNVIPESVNQTSIKIVGEWDSFNITWSPIIQVNYGQVFYEIKIEYNNRLHIEYTGTEPQVGYSGGEVPPYSAVDMSVRAHTYWGTAAVARARLHSPQAPPSLPTKPRIFILHHTSPVRNENEVTAVFRWNQPMFINGIIKGYRVDCWYREDNIDRSVCQKEIVPPEQLQYFAKNVLRNVSYYFQVQAFTDAGDGPITRPVWALTDDESPIPRLALGFRDSIRIVDLDSGYGYTVTRSAGKPVDFAVSLREGLIYWMNEVQEIFVSKLDKMGHSKLLSINGTAVSITVDWVSRMLYWSQIENSPDQYGCAIYRMDLNIYELEGTIQLQRILRRNTHITKLQVSSITNSIYWIEMNQHDFGKLMTSHIDGSDVRSFFDRNQRNYRNNSDSQNVIDRQCNCPEDPAVGRTFTLDLTNPNNLKLYWIDGWLKHITSADLDACHCKVIVNATQFNDNALPPNYITVDSEYIYWSNNSQNQLYSAEKSLSNAYKIKHINITHGYKILALGSKIQPYPPKNCLSPKQVPLKVTLVNRTFDSLTLLLPEPVKYDTCRNINMPTPYYTVFYQPYVEGESNQCNDSSCTSKRTFDGILHLDGLRPFSKYAFSVQITNYYGELQDIKPVLGEPIIFRTSAGAPASATNIRTVVLTPTEARVEWSTPPAGNLEGPDISYEVHWRTEGTLTPEQSFNEHRTFGTKMKPPPPQNVSHVELMKLVPGQTYSVWVRAHSNHSQAYSDSECVSMEMFPLPNKVRATFVGPYLMHVSWLPYQKIETIQQSIEYAEYTSDSWKNVDDEGSRNDDGTINFVLQNLHPKTQYKFRLQVIFLNNTSPYIWPQDSSFVFETLGDKPSPPGRPIIQHLSDSVYQLQWAPSSPHGSAIVLYRLFGHARSIDEERVRTHRNARNAQQLFLDYGSDNSVSRDRREADYSEPQADLPRSLYVEENTDSMLFVDEPLKDGWKMLYNGTDNHWIISKLKPNERYTFFAQSQNGLGWSELSEASEEFDFSETKTLAAQHDYLSITLGIGISLFIIIPLVIGGCICIVKQRDKKSPPGVLTARGPDVELASLRELPRWGGGGAGVLQRSVLYSPADADLALLPHIMREHITLTKFLGSGAFGEVFEGKAKNLESVGSEIRVAVKTLRKGATAQEKTEFLQEAQLMSNFKHEHILRMLGVCLDNDPHFIIMELMEGGDLLSYLRARRPMLYTNETLTLHDLLSMCVDVTRGCRYMEELHFVHRDLACRNCLVSHQAGGRIVKIGDFGLARDIYKNDYYRKEGEGLLPVRWMAVECLTDGVFSRASDVWAWAVLCWEVAALGRQPYPALPNHAVMRYVRAGGTLHRPPNCPLPLFKLLQKCWSYNPEQRPTFKHCLEVLENLMETISQDAVLSAVMNEEPQYITVMADVAGISNRMYFMDENQNNDCSGEMDNMTSFGEMSEEVPDIAHTPEIVTEGPPKYLELIYDSDTPPTCSDGYEVPRASIRSSASRHTLERRPVSTPVGPEIIRARTLQSSFNGARLGRSSAHFSESDKHNSLQKLIPNGGLRRSLSGVSRNMSGIQVSDDSRMFNNNPSEAKRLLTSFSNGGTGFTLPRENSDSVASATNNT